MNIKFQVKGKKNYNTIYVRFYKGAQVDLSTATELCVKPEHWDYKKQQLRNASSFTNYNSIRNVLLKIETAVYENYQKDFISGVHINTEWLRQIIFKEFNRPTNEALKEYEDKDIFFSAWSLNWLKESEGVYIKKNGKSLSEKDAYEYNLVIGKFIRFETWMKKRFKFADFTRKLKLDFKKFLIEQEQYTAITSIATMNRLSYLHKRATNSGIKMNQAWNEVNNSIEDPNDVDLTFLDEAEINRLASIDLSGNENLDIARDNFIIGLRSGLRISDYMFGLSEDLLRTGQILVTTKKTKTKVQIPIHPQVREILMKWRGLPPKQSELKFGEYIKKVAMKAEINEPIQGGVMTKGVKLWDGTLVKRKVYRVYPKHELIVSHTARRSFATNLYIDGVDNQTIMQVGGWSTEGMMLHYVKKFGDKSSHKVAKNWNMEIKPIDFNELKIVS